MIEHGVLEWSLPRYLLIILYLNSFVPFTLDFIVIHRDYRYFIVTCYCDYFLLVDCPDFVWVEDTKNITYI